MDIRLPLHIEHCQADCPFSSTEPNINRPTELEIWCAFQMTAKKIPSDDIPEWCPLRRFIHHEATETVPSLH